MRHAWIPGTLAATALAAACVEPARVPPCPPAATGAAAAATTAPVASAAPTSTAAPTASATIAIPSAEVPKATSEKPDQLGLAVSLWQTFVAVNWPADVQKYRGVPADPTNTEKYKDLRGPRVWETWKQNWETSGDLSDWNSYEADLREVPCRYVVDKQGTMTKVTKENWPSLYKDVGGGTVLANFNTLKPKVLGSKAPDGVPFDETGPLLDANNDYVAFEIRFNKELYDCVKDGAGEGCARSSDAITLPAADTQRHGAITLKASWRKVSPDMVQSMFYVRDMLVLGFEKVAGAKAKYSPVCRVESRALVGTHIVFKDKYIAAGLSKANQWFWASFEQTSNSVLCNPLPGPSYDTPLLYGFLPKRGFSEELSPLQPAPFPVPDPRKRIAVCRLNPLTAVVTTPNGQFQPALAGYAPWSNYQMVANQWQVGNGFAPPAGSGVANVTMEPYAQTDSCGNCHSGEAAKTDFVWSLDLSRTHREKLANDLDLSD